MAQAAKESDPVVNTAPPPVLFTIYCWDCEREYPARRWKLTKDESIGDFVYVCPRCGGKQG